MEDVHVNNINVIAVKEDKLVQAASKELEKYTNTTINSREELNATSNDVFALVKKGEATPFQVLEKGKDKEGSRVPSDLLHLEKYFETQAKFAGLKKRTQNASIESKAVPNNKERTKHKKISELCCKISKKEPIKDIAKPTSNHLEKNEISSDEGSEYFPSEEDDEVYEKPKTGCKRKRNILRNIKCRKAIDDGDVKYYNERMKLIDHTKYKDLHAIKDNVKVPSCLWNRLYKYQKVAVKWLWELYDRGVGGLLADEMGLGKSIQVIVFLASVDCSEMLSKCQRFRGLGPTLIVCPATVMEQWVKYFHEWWPLARVALLHYSGSIVESYENLMNSVANDCGVLVTSYSCMVKYRSLLTQTKWHFVILDEGHKIRNPHAKVTQTAKGFSTPYRLVLTGSPMQNHLEELWCLFDFVLPGKLGTLPEFMELCAKPITTGGFANASNAEKTTALEIATLLKDAITPYILRRTKADVKHHTNLPEKEEQVLFCSPTNEQKVLYKQFLSSESIHSLLHSKVTRGADILNALTNLRKICNHPDLFTYMQEVDSDEELDLTQKMLERFGHWERSGKMVVLRSLLKMWKEKNDRVLLFSQSSQMLVILESLLQQENYSYLKMDGSTPTSMRQHTIEEFNDNSSYFVFLLTTRVGGLGINLNGANRVVIFDPDWNPAHDTQAKERAWRIGQTRNVAIYRLVTSGTIEEKIYHRQIFKLLLSSKVLDDPRQSAIFTKDNLKELFNLNEPLNGESCESERLFKESLALGANNVPKFSESKIKQMRELAAAISKSISKSSSTSSEESSDKSSSTKEYPSEKINSSRQSMDKENNNNVSVLSNRKSSEKKHKKEKQQSTNFSGSSSTDNFVLQSLLATANLDTAVRHDSVLSNAYKNAQYKASTQSCLATQDLIRFLKESNRSTAKAGCSWRNS